MIFSGIYRRLLSLVFLLVVASTGCMVGPDFHSPQPPNTERYTPSPLPAKTVSTPMLGKAGKSQHFVAGHPVLPNWWTLFDSPALNNLIEKALANNPTVQSAQAALWQAQENLKAQIGSTLYPAVTGTLSGTRERFSPASFGATGPPVTFNLFNAAVNVSYTLDVFGGARRAIEALAAQVDYEQYQMEATYLTLTSNIVTTAIAIASLRAQIQATHQLIQFEREILSINEKQFRLGGNSLSDVLAQRSELAQTMATLPVFEQNLAKNRHALSVLVGELPSESQLPQFDFERLSLPTQLPTSFPSALVRQRPDIRASEALLHAACAQMGVATANLYPQINLTGSYGTIGNTLEDLFKSSHSIWNYGGTLLQPIFNAGALLAKKRAAVAAFEQAVGQYRQTVLQAFQQMADTLRALEHDAELLSAQADAEMSARKSLALLKRQFELGGVSYLALFVAQKQYQETRINRIQAQGARYADTVALFQALGGGRLNGT